MSNFEKVTVILSGMVDEKVTVILMLNVIHYYVHTKAKMEVENWDQSQRWKMEVGK